MREQENTSDNEPEDAYANEPLAGENWWAQYEAKRQKKQKTQLSCFCSDLFRGLRRGLFPASMMFCHSFNSRDLSGVYTNFRTFQSVFLPLRVRELQLKKIAAFFPVSYKDLIRQKTFFGVAGTLMIQWTSIPSRGEWSRDASGCPILYFPILIIIQSVCPPNYCC